MPSRLSVNTLLIIVNVAVFLLQLQIGYKMEMFALWPTGDSPYGEGSLFRPWQLLTYGFMHDTGGFMHIFFNMFALFMFGGRIEQLFGPRRYLIYYLACVVGAAALHLIVSAVSEQPFSPMVGASGAVFGLLLAFGMAWPREKLMVIPIPIPLPAWLFVTLYGIAELIFGMTQTLQGIAHFAHLGGMVTGFVMIRYWRQQARRLRR
jgi:membrane associated rhomboid family serine protease